MSFFSDLFGGPSSQQQGLANNESSLAGQMSNAFTQQFGAQSSILQNLNNQLTPVANLGPNQQGYSPQELAAMNTQAINNSGAAARNAQQSVAGTLAGQGGGGGNGLVSGIQQQIQGTIASSAANNLASTQNQITQQNYNVGRQNFENAVSGEQNLARAYNPEAFGNLASSTNQSALQDANQIAQEKQAAAFAPLSLAAKLGGDVLTGGMGNLSSDSSFGENVGNFFTGAIGNLAGNGTGTRPNPSSSGYTGPDMGGEGIS
jgi:hypothetical protein